MALHVAAVVGNFSSPEDFTLEIAFGDPALGGLGDQDAIPRNIWA